MTLYDELVARNLLAQATHPDQVKEQLEQEGQTFYLGIDPTAQSLTAGHMCMLLNARRLQEAGHRPIFVLGAGTTLIGDPTGKDEMRQMMSAQQIQSNAKCIEVQLRKFVNFEDGQALLLNNYDWLKDLNYIEFLRMYGPHFNVNTMMHMESVQRRMDKGLSLLEFNYMPMQAYDFLHLYRTYGCTLQIGGSDQWSNIIGGVELVRKLEEAKVFGLTFELLTTASGEKMGKTAAGAVWLDPERTSPYDFYQYWRNVEDKKILQLLGQMSMRPLEELEAYQSLEGKDLNRAKEDLAFELTELVHGKEEAKKATEAARSLFEEGSESENMPSIQVKEAIGMKWLDLFLACELIASKSQGRSLIDQRGLRVNENVLEDPYEEASEEDFEKGYAILRKGKKSFYKILL